MIRRPPTFVLWMLTLACLLGAGIYFLAQGPSNEKGGSPNKHRGSSRNMDGLSPAAVKFSGELPSHDDRLLPARPAPLPTNRDRLEQEVVRLKTQSAVLRDLTGDELIKRILELAIENATIGKIYPEYLAETEQLKRASESGFGGGHPKILGLSKSVEIKHDQMLAAAETIKSNLEVQMKSAQQMLTKVQNAPPDHGGASGPDTTTKGNPR